MTIERYVITVHISLRFGPRTSGLRFGDKTTESLIVLSHAFTVDGTSKHASPPFSFQYSRVLHLPYTPPRTLVNEQSLYTMNS